MAIGIFENGQQVLEAVEKLQSLGWDKRALRVIVRSGDNVPLLIGQLDTPLEEIAGILEAREDDSDVWSGIPFAAMLGTGSGQWTAMPLFASGLANPADGWIPGRSEANEMDRVLADMGVSEPSVRACREALLQGKCVLVAEAEPEAAERALREAGAERVLQS
mgnify:FL=1